MHPGYSRHGHETENVDASTFTYEGRLLPKNSLNSTIKSAVDPVRLANADSAFMRLSRV